MATVGRTTGVATVGRTTDYSRVNSHLTMVAIIGSQAVVILQQCNCSAVPHQPIIICDKVTTVMTVTTDNFPQSLLLTTRCHMFYSNKQLKNIEMRLTK